MNDDPVTTPTDEPTPQEQATTSDESMTPAADAQSNEAEPATEPVPVASEETAQEPVEPTAPEELEAAPASAAEVVEVDPASVPAADESTESPTTPEQEQTPEAESEAIADAAGEPEPVPDESPDVSENRSPATEAEPTAKPKRTRKKAATATDAMETEATPAATATEDAPPESKKKWYAIKVQSGREDTIKAAILRKVAIEGLEEFVGQIMIPVEEVVEKKSVKVKDKKTGESTYQEKKVTKKKKKFHGYIFAEVEFNDRILYLFRETSGVGDFLNMRSVKGKPPTPEPMPDHEVQSMLTGERHKDPLKAKKVKLDFEKGDKVRIREGSFANSEGEVKAISETKDPTETPKVTVVLTFWGRPLDVELDASQVEKV